MSNRNYPKISTATTVIPFDNPVTAIPVKTVSGAVTFTKNTTAAQAGYGAIIRVVADGTNLPDFSAFKKIGTGSYDNTSGVVNLCIFLFDGTDYCVQFTQPATISGGGGVDTTPPTLVSGNATDSTHVTLVFSETVVPTVVGWSIYNGTSTFSFGTVSGSGTTWTFVLASGTLSSGDTLTVAYNPTTGNTLDTAGNELGAISSQSITNSIGGSGDPDANAYIAAVQATGQTVSSGRQTALQTFFAGLTSNGIKPLITGFGFIPLWSTDAANRKEIYARTSWTEYGSTLIPSTTGLSGDGSDWADTAVNVNTLLQNDISFGWFCLSTSQTNTYESPMGANDGTNFCALLYTGGNVYANVNSGQAPSGAAALARGFDVADRPDSTHEKFVRNGSVLINSAVTSVAQPNKTFGVVAEKNSISVGGNPMTMKTGFFYAGKSMEAAGKSAAFSTLVNNLMTAFGV